MTHEATDARDRGQTQQNIQEPAIAEGALDSGREHNMTYHLGGIGSTAAALLSMPRSDDFLATVTAVHALMQDSTAP